MGCLSSKSSEEGSHTSGHEDNEIEKTSKEGLSSAPATNVSRTLENDSAQIFDEENVHKLESKTVLKSQSKNPNSFFSKLKHVFKKEKPLETIPIDYDDEEKRESVGSGLSAEYIDARVNSNASFVTGTSKTDFSKEENVVPERKPILKSLPPSPLAAKDGLDGKAQESVTALPGYAGSFHHHRRMSKDFGHVGILDENKKTHSNEDLPSTEQLNVSEDDPHSSSDVILPSAGPSMVSSRQHPAASLSDQCKEENDNDILLALMKVACLATDNSLLCQVSENATSFQLQRTTCFSSEFKETLPMLLSTIKLLKRLCLNNNAAGPVAIRAILSSLIKYDCVKELDISENMSDPDCAVLIGKLLLTSKNLKHIKLSGNHFGKESLSRCLTEAVSINGTLTHLDISECGASNLHGLFEGIRTVCFSGLSQLQYLDISNNHIKDGQQLGIDLSLVLEHGNCKLKNLIIENTGLNSVGWSALIAGLKANSTLRRFIAGGSNNQIKNLSQLGEVLVVNEFIVYLHLGGIKLEEEIRQEEILFPASSSLSLALQEVDLNNCSLQDEFFTKLAVSWAGRLCNLVSMNISNNADLTEAGINGLSQLLADGGSSLISLQIAGISLDFLPNVLINSFPHLTSLSLAKARISVTSLNLLSNCSQVLREITLDGIKISGSNFLIAIFANGSTHQLTKISLSGCALADADMDPLITALGRPGGPLNSLKSLNLSVNRLTAALKPLSVSLMSCKNHPLDTLDLSNNAVEDIGACELAKCILSTNSKSNLKRLNISHNCLSKEGIDALVSAVASNPDGKGLVSLDVSSQKDPLCEEELESIIESLSNSIGLDGMSLLPEDRRQPIPLLSSKVNVNLTNLGGSVGIRAKMLDSVAVKTDFTKLCSTSANLTDFLLVGAGLDVMHNYASSSDELNNCVHYSGEEWSAIIGTDAPTWLKVNEQRKKGVYINHLPGTVTLQRLEGLLEMEADCDVSDTFLIKDSIVRKPTGAAWVLFKNERSVEQAMKWYAEGEARMYGTPFCICSIPVMISDNADNTSAVAADKEKLARDAQRKKEEENERVMMEESQRLAEERAAYREAHPAYQNGRIW